MIERTLEDKIIAKNEEYETQLYGFGRQKIKESLKSFIEYTIQTKIQEANDFLSSSLNFNEATNAKVSLKFAELTKYCLDKSIRPLEDMENELDKFFKIPENILLVEDEDQRIPASEEELEKLRLEVEDLRVRAQRAQAFEMVLERELKETDALLPLLGAVDWVGRALEVTRMPANWQPLVDVMGKVEHDKLLDYLPNNLDDGCG